MWVFCQNGNLPELSPASHVAMTPGVRRWPRPCGNDRKPPHWPWADTSGPWMSYGIYNNQTMGTHGIHHSLDDIDIGNHTCK
jgi:hypothetical protein